MRGGLEEDPLVFVVAVLDYKIPASGAGLSQARLTPEGSQTCWGEQTWSPQTDLFSFTHSSQLNSGQVGFAQERQRPLVAIQQPARQLPERLPGFPGWEAVSVGAGCFSADPCPSSRPGDSYDRHPNAASIPIPPGPQSWSCTSTAWFHVPA